MLDIPSKIWMPVPVESRVALPSRRSQRVQLSSRDAYTRGWPISHSIQHRWATRIITMPPLHRSNSSNSSMPLTPRRIRGRLISGPCLRETSTTLPQIRRLILTPCRDLSGYSTLAIQSSVYQKDICQEVQIFHPLQVFLGFKSMKGTVDQNTWGEQWFKHPKRARLFNNLRYHSGTLFNHWQRTRSTIIATMRLKGSYPILIMVKRDHLDAIDAKLTSILILLSRIMVSVLSAICVISWIKFQFHTNLLWTSLDKGEID